MNVPIDITGVALVADRMTLRPLRDSDLNDLYAYARVDGVGQMAGWKPHANIDESHAILGHFMQDRMTFALEYQGKIIGSLSVEEYNEDHYPELARLHGREIGHVLSRDFWGRVLMPEAVRAVIDYLFFEVGLDFLLCCHYDWNLQTARVMDKCGFRPYRNALHQTQFGTTEASIERILFNPAGTATIQDQK